MQRVSRLLVAVTFAAVAVNVNGDAVGSSGNVPQAANDYPLGDPRRCMEVARKNGYKMQSFEVLPGFGWDNLRNVYEGQVVGYNYSTCRTTDDGRFLLPDSVSAVPVKASSVQTFAELITHWTNWTSSTSKSINVDAGLNLAHFGINGKFSAEFEDLKSKQIGDKSMTTRAQLRYIRYLAQLQPDTPLHPVFRKRLLAIAAAKELNQQEQSRYLSQLLVRDYGTHTVTKVSAGASLEQVDHINENWLRTQIEHKSDILASASASLFSVFKMSASYETKTVDNFVQTYKEQRTSSSVMTKGGAIFRPANVTADSWAKDVDNDLVALDRSGDPLYYVITEEVLPELPASILNEVYEEVKIAVENYYAFNRIPGCLEPTSPNFSPAANTDDGSCKPPPTNLTFGGVYQTCSNQPGSNNGDLCGGLTQVNPLTGGYSCPQGYQTVKLHSGSMTSSRTEHVCHSYFLFWHKCHDDYYHSQAVYTINWCVATGSVPPNTGYLFGGLYTSKMDNLVTRAKSCPTTYFPLKVGDRADIHVCISDDYEFGAEFSIPFAGFISCEAGNPLAVSTTSPGKSSKKSSAQGSSSDLRTFFKKQEPNEWPMHCPEGYSRHLATVDQGCQINYCVRTGSLSAPVLPPIKRPPFSFAPPVPSPASDNLVIFDPKTKTWKRNQEALNLTHSMPGEEPQSSEDTISLSPGAAAGISITATLACTVIAILAYVAFRAKRQQRNPGYRRLENPIINAQEDYGSVRTSGGGTSRSVTVDVVEN